MPLSEPKQPTAEFKRFRIIITALGIALVASWVMLAYSGIFKSLGVPLSCVIVGGDIIGFAVIAYLIYRTLPKSKE